MAKKIYVVTDLGPGDGGKGGIVHTVATKRCAHTIIKVGGAQGNHGVCTSRGKRFAFSQWGCATFEGVKTHLSMRFVVSPEGILNEAEALRVAGIDHPFDLLTVDENALCSTDYHGIASRLIELSHGNSPRGTIGSGVGQAYRYAERLPELALYVRDLSGTDLCDRMAAVRARVIQDIAPVFEQGFLPEDQDLAQAEMTLLHDDAFLGYVVERFQEATRRMTIIDQDTFAKDILGREGVIVVESSHGILTDSVYGFQPHTSALRTLPHFAGQMLRDAGHEGHIVNLAVHRAYTIRHGAGPMPTTDASMGEMLLPGSNKDANRWQGNVRVGPLDLNFLRYAIAASGGPSAYDGLALTWFDQIRHNGEWRICRRYANTNNEHFFTPEGDLRFRLLPNDLQYAYQCQLTAHLKLCVPEVESMLIASDATDAQVVELCKTTLNDAIGVPVRMLSLGPTEADKVFI